jgi:hypothetical protein
MQTNPGLSQAQVNARQTAGTALIAAAGHTSESFDKLATWFLGGFGAALTFTLANLKEVSTFVPVSYFGSAAFWFILASVSCLLQRYVATIVQAGTLAAEDGRKIGERLLEKSQSFDLPEFNLQMAKAIPGPFRFLAARMFQKIASGDLAAGGRWFIQLAVLQGMLAFCEVVLLLVAVWRIVSQIKT